MAGPDPKAGYDLDADLALLVSAAREAGEAAMGYFRQSPETWWKNGGRSPVTAGDYAANDVLIRRLREARPEYGWISEETEDDGGRTSFETLFVVDPIDGTRAFMNGMDTWCVSAAVVQNRRPVAGVLVAPALGEVFTARLDGPALLNGAPIVVARPDAGRMLTVASPADAFHRLTQARNGLYSKAAHIPSLAYRLAMIAAGRLDATLVHPNSHDWDLAAAELILERAGGALRKLEGGAIAYNGKSMVHGGLGAAHSDHVDDLLKAASGVFSH